MNGMDSGTYRTAELCLCRCLDLGDPRLDSGEGNGRRDVRNEGGAIYHKSRQYFGSTSSEFLTPETSQRMRNVVWAYTRFSPAQHEYIMN